MLMARERKKSAKQQAADAALAEKADAKREQEERRKNKTDPREKRARGDDVHKAEGTAKRHVPVKGRGAAKPKPPPPAPLVPGARVGAKATAFGVAWARSTYGSSFKTAVLFGTVQRDSDPQATGEIVQVKWDAGEGFESMDHALHRPDVRLLPRPSTPRPSPTQQPAKKKQTKPREAEGKSKAALSKKRPAAVRRRSPPHPSCCAPIYRVPTK